MQSFSEYFLLTERVGWRLTDFDFTAIDLDHVSEDDRLKARETAITESAVPHYVSTWAAVDHIGEQWELRQFAALWAGEEHRHSEGLRMLCDALDIDLGVDLAGVQSCDFVEAHHRACASGCYRTVSGLLTYTVLQELITWKFYANWAKTTESVFLSSFLAKIAADEMRHHQWFANALQRCLPLAADPQAYRRAIVDAVAAFRMPHNNFPAAFPVFNSPEARYFSSDDVEHMKEKIVKILTFDAELTMMLLERGEDALMHNLGATA